MSWWSRLFNPKTMLLDTANAALDQAMLGVVEEIGALKGPTSEEKRVMTTGANLLVRRARTELAARLGFANG